MSYRITMIVPDLKRAEAVRLAAGPHSAFVITGEESIDLHAPEPPLKAQRPPLPPLKPNPRPARDCRTGIVILELLKSKDRPIMLYEIQAEFKRHVMAPKSASPAITRLMRAGDIVKLGPASYGLPPSLDIIKESGNNFPNTVDLDSKGK